MQSRIKHNIFLFACMLAVLSAPAAYGENPSWHTGGGGGRSPPCKYHKKNSTDVDKTNPRSSQNFRW